MRRHLKLRIGTLLLGILSPLATAIPAHAATTTWVGGGEYGWTDDANWSSGSPGANDTAVFSTDSPHNLEVGILGTSQSVAKIEFSGEVPTSSGRNYVISGKGLSISEGIEAIMTGAGGDHSVGVSVTLTADATFKTSGVDTLAIGDDNKTLDLGSHDLTIDASGGTISILGEVAGSGKLIKSGDGKLKLLATPGSGYSGSIDLSEGVLSIDETFGAANVTINGGTLKGSGSVGEITMTSGTIAPGNSPGCLNSSDMSLTGGSYDVELGGTSVTNCEYDNMVVTGAVDLGSDTTLNLSLVSEYAPSKDDTYSIILNDGTDAISGAFKGLDEGEKFTLGSYTYQISYKGGDGNDITVKVTGTPSAPDTGSESILQRPWMTLALAAFVALIGFSHYYIRTKKR
ncbi:MAG TPA: hypothetical protein PKD20_04315 [Candidatus Saccharibacteria bacterium]|nr:hypothetical protein [Candidatus Saccharibacteria bacterium]HMT56072.1 hypothetical protein [Candidatus Saccharibacteria bacterium]